MPSGIPPSGSARHPRRRSEGPALPGGSVYTDNRAPVEWLIDQSLLDDAAGRPAQQNSNLGGSYHGFVNYVRLYTDDSGQTRFEDLEFSFAPHDFAPPAPPLDVSEPIDALALLMLRGPSGRPHEAHPSPARQFLIVLQGSWRVSTADETRRFSVGDIVLTDASTPSGLGHGSTIVEDTVLAVVRL